MKPYKCMQIIGIELECLKPFNSLQILILDWEII